MTRKQSRELIGRLNRDAERIAAQFSLAYRCIEAEHANVKRRYGVCYSDGTIRIRLRHATSGKPLKYSSLVNTLCHELAHLRHFNHGLRFREFYRGILEWSRGEGIYQPSRGSAIAAPGAGAETAGRNGDLIDLRRAGALPSAMPVTTGSGGSEDDVRTGVQVEAEQLSLFG